MRPGAQFPPVDPAILEREIGFEPTVQDEGPGWRVIAIAWAVGLSLLVALWSGDLF